MQQTDHLKHRCSAATGRRQPRRQSDRQAGIFALQALIVVFLLALTLSWGVLSLQRLVAAQRVAAAARAFSASLQLARTEARVRAPAQKVSVIMTQPELSWAGGWSVQARNREATTAGARLHAAGRQNPEAVADVAEEWPEVVAQGADADGRASASKKGANPDRLVDPHPGLASRRAELIENVSAWPGVHAAQTGRQSSLTYHGIQRGMTDAGRALAPRSVWFEAPGTDRYCLVLNGVGRVRTARVASGVDCHAG